MICKNCGAEFGDELEFCPECNAPANGSPAEETVSGPVEKAADETAEEEIIDEDLIEAGSDNAAEIAEEDTVRDIDEIKAEAEEEEAEADKSSGKAGLIIAIIAVILVIAAGTVIMFASKKDYSGVSSLNKFFFSLKSDESKQFLNGIWQVKDSDTFYEFKGNTAKFYKKANLQQTFNVKYVSRNEIVLSCTTDDGLTFTESMKPILNEKEKTLSFLIYYETYEVSEDSRENTKMSLSKVNSLPKPFSIEEKMSDDAKAALQGTWKGKQALGDKQDDTSITINGETASWQNSDWSVIYANDGELVLKIDYNDYECYLGFNYTLKKDTLKMTLKYQVLDNERSDVEEENQTILTLKKQK